MVKVLELFSGTHSVGKVCEKFGFEVVSLDLNNADINIDILKWDYTIYKSNEFDIIWASPPCHTFSSVQNTWIGRSIKGELVTKQSIRSRIEKEGLPLLRKAQEIIEYFKPTYYFIENPQTGKMKDYLDLPYYDIDYCRYSDWGYKKRTRIWTNLKGFTPLLCENKCENRIPNSKIHRLCLGGNQKVLVNNKWINIKTKELRIKYKDHSKPNFQQTNLNERYRIPPNLIEELLSLSKINPNFKG